MARMRRIREFKCRVCGEAAFPLPGTGYWCKNCGWRDKTPPYERLGILTW